jgi:hypothetical protein
MFMFSLLVACGPAARLQEGLSFVFLHLSFRVRPIGVWDGTRRSFHCIVQN